MSQQDDGISRHEHMQLKQKKQQQRAVHSQSSARRRDAETHTPPTPADPSAAGTHSRRYSNHHHSTDTTHSHQRHHPHQQHEDGEARPPKGSVSSYTKKKHHPVTDCGQRKQSQHSSCLSAEPTSDADHWHRKPHSQHHTKQASISEQAASAGLLPPPPPPRYGEHTNARPIMSFFTGPRALAPLATATATATATADTAETLLGSPSAVPAGVHSTTAPASSTVSAKDAVGTPPPGPVHSDPAAPMSILCTLGRRFPSAVVGRAQVPATRARHATGEDVRRAKPFRSRPTTSATPPPPSPSPSALSTHRLQHEVAQSHGLVRDVVALVAATRHQQPAEAPPQWTDPSWEEFTEQLKTPPAPPAPPTPEVLSGPLLVHPQPSARMVARAARKGVDVRHLRVAEQEQQRDFLRRNLAHILSNPRLREQLGQPLPHDWPVLTSPLIPPLSLPPPPTGPAAARDDPPAYAQEAPAATLPLGAIRVGGLGMPLRYDDEYLRRALPADLPPFVKHLRCVGEMAAPPLLQYFHAAPSMLLEAGFENGPSGPVISSRPATSSSSSDGGADTATSVMSHERVVGDARCPKYLWLPTAIAPTATKTVRGLYQGVPPTYAGTRGCYYTRAIGAQRSSVSARDLLTYMVKVTLPGGGASSTGMHQPALHETLVQRSLPQDVHCPFSINAVFASPCDESINGAMRRYQQQVEPMGDPTRNDAVGPDDDEDGHGPPLLQRLPRALRDCLRPPYKMRCGGLPADLCPLVLAESILRASGVVPLAIGPLRTSATTTANAAAALSHCYLYVATWAEAEHLVNALHQRAWFVSPVTANGEHVLPNYLLPLQSGTGGTVAGASAHILRAFPMVPTGLLVAIDDHGARLLARSVPADIGAWAARYKDTHDAEMLRRRAAAADAAGSQGELLPQHPQPLPAWAQSAALPPVHVSAELLTMTIAVPKPEPRPLSQPPAVPEQHRHHRGGSPMVPRFRAGTGAPPSPSPHLPPPPPFIGIPQVSPAVLQQAMMEANVALVRERLERQKKDDYHSGGLPTTDDHSQQTCLSAAAVAPEASAVRDTTTTNTTTTSTSTAAMTAADGSPVTAPASLPPAPVLVTAEVATGLPPDVRTAVTALLIGAASMRYGRLPTGKSAAAPAAAAPAAAAPAAAAPAATAQRRDCTRMDRAARASSPSAAPLATMAPVVAAAAAANTTTNASARMRPTVIPGHGTRTGTQPSAVSGAGPTAADRRALQDRLQLYLTKNQSHQERVNPIQFSPQFEWLGPLTTAMREAGGYDGLARDPDPQRGWTCHAFRECQVSASWSAPTPPMGMAAPVPVPAPTPLHLSLFGTTASSSPQRAPIIIPTGYGSY